MLFAAVLALVSFGVVHTILNLPLSTNSSVNTNSSVSINSSVNTNSSSTPTLSCYQDTVECLFSMQTTADGQISSPCTTKSLSTTAEVLYIIPSLIVLVTHSTNMYIVQQDYYTTDVRCEVIVLGPSSNAIVTLYSDGDQVFCYCEMETIHIPFTLRYLHCRTVITRCQIK